MKSLNVIDRIFAREIRGKTDSQDFFTGLEDAYWETKCWSVLDYPTDVDTTLSTIAIALSHDGFTFASTHGDHTIKVSNPN
jgi:hypothetical protein